MTRFSKSKALASSAAFVVLVLFAVVSITANTKLGYVFASDGKYLVVDSSSLATVKTGNIWDDFKAQGLKTSISEFAAEASILKVKTDASSGYAFLLVGSPKTGELNGFLVVDLESLKPIGVIRQPMVLGPVTLLTNKASDRIYISYLKPAGSETGEFSRVTRIYELSTLKPSSQVASRDLRLTPGSCVLGDDLLYSNHRIYDARTTKEVHSTRFERKPYLDVDCQNGRVLLLSATPGKKFLLTVYDARNNQVIAEIPTDSEFRINEGEWRLAQEGRMIVRDEDKVVTVGQSRMLVRTGQLSLFTVSPPAKAGEVQVPDVSEGSGMLGESADGNYLFYRTQEKLYIVDLSKRSIMGSVKSGLDAVGVVWP